MMFRRTQTAILALFASGGLALTASPVPDREFTRWSTDIMIGAGYSDASPRGFLRKGTAIGNPTVEFKDASHWGAAADCRLAKDVTMRLGLSISDLAFGAELIPAAPPFTITDEDLGTARLETFEITGFFDPEEDPFRPAATRRTEFRIGLSVALAQLGNVQTFQKGTGALGIVKVEAESGLEWGIRSDWIIRLGRSPWFLAPRGAFFFGNAPQLKMTTSDASAFNGGSLEYAPFTFELSVGYRWPARRRS